MKREVLLIFLMAVGLLTGGGGRQVKPRQNFPPRKIYIRQIIR